MTLLGGFSIKENAESLLLISNTNILNHQPARDQVPGQPVV